jgi:thioesterase domain-containing protein
MTCYAFLPGTGGGAPNLSGLKASSDETTCFEVIKYPGWKRYVDPLFEPHLLAAELADEIIARVPSGPIHILGLSIGGHFGYLAALHLRAQGREVAALCVIDSMMRMCVGPNPDWKSRALTEAFDLLARERYRELIRFLRSKFWRASIRVAGGRLPHLLRRASRIGWLSYALDKDPILKQELDMRMMGSEVAPWIASLEDNPSVLPIPTVFFRTQLNAYSDAAWRVRCSNLSVYEISGEHHRLFESENIDSLRAVFLRATREWG